VQEKITDLTPFALELGYLVEEYAAGKGSIPPLKRKNKNCIFVCTIEKSLILFDSLYELNRAGEVGLVVVDELHMVGDSHRGYVLETLLSKMMFLTDEIQIVGMSATIANLNEIAMFLKADLYTKQFRPVELKEYVKFGKDLMEVKDNAEHIKDAFVLARTLEVSYDRKMQQRDPDHLMALVYEVIPKESCLVFCPTKQNCESVALLLVEMLPKELQQHRKDEKIELMNAIKLDSGGTLCNVLVKTIPFGVAYHHSGLTAEERKHIEDAYRLGIICALCCTSTLAAGVNLPAKRVIIRSPYTGPEFLTKSRYKQMVGRAGRAGHAAAGESIMICGPNDNSKIARLFCSPMDEVTSGFLTDESRIFLQTVIMNCIDNEVASNFSRLLEFFELTLMGIQSQKFQVEIYEEVKNGLKVLFRNGAVAIQINEDQRDTRSLDITQSSQRKLELNYFDHLSVSQLGKGAVKAGISLEKASQLYKHLQTAQKSFDLSNYLHLLYLVTPDDAVAAIKPNFRIYHDVFFQLDPVFIHTAEIIGIR
jgi:POLQ-like helicase